MIFKKQLSTIGLLTFMAFSTCANAEISFNSITDSFKNFTLMPETKDEAALKLEQEQLNTKSIEICKNSVLELYKESIDYPTEINFHSIDLLESAEHKIVNIQYSFLRKHETVKQKISCEFSLNEETLSNGSKKTWKLSKEIRSY